MLDYPTDMPVEQKLDTPLSGRVISDLRDFNPDAKRYNRETPSLVVSGNGRELEVHCHGLTTFIMESGSHIPGIRLWSIDEEYPDKIGYFQSDLTLPSDEVRASLKFGFDEMRLPISRFSGSSNVDYIIFKIQRDSRLYTLGYESFPRQVTELPLYRPEDFVLKEFAGIQGRAGLKSVLVWGDDHNKLTRVLKSLDTH